MDNQYSDALRPGGHLWRAQYPNTYNVSKFYRQDQIFVRMCIKFGLV